MSKKIQITEKQALQFNQMLAALREIKSYQSTEKLRKDSEKELGLDFEEALEYAYDNVKTTASNASKGISPIKTNL